MRDSFLVILALIAFSLGTFSALTKFCANEVTSTPEPAPKEVSSFWALALLAAAVAAGVLAKAAEVDELKAVVAMKNLSYRCADRREFGELEPINPNT